MKWYYKWRYKKHLFKSTRYQSKAYQTLFNIEIEKMRYYRSKLEP